jgi:hypothetical protein
MAPMSAITIVLLVLLLGSGGGPLAFDEIARSAGVAKGGDAGAVAWFDMDGDGDEDLYVANLGPDRLFRNDGTGRFMRLKKTGLEGGQAFGLGVAVGDYDNDGRLDVFVANLGSPSRLYHNDGGAVFRDQARAAGVAGGSASSFSAAWADYDNDGLLDLYVANGSQQLTAPNFLYHNEGGGRFAEVGARAGVAGNESSLGCAWGDYDNDGLPDLYVANFSQPNQLYRNNGDGTFTDRSRQAGVDDDGNGAGAAWGDYDNDGNLDLYLFNTNDGSDVDRLYRNRGDGTFADVTVAVGLSAHEDGEAVLWADLDNDGWLDLYLVNRSDFSRQRNRLWRNLGGARFADVASSAGVDGSGAGHPAAFADYDGDGRLDVFVGNFPGTPDELFHNRTEGGNALVVRLAGRQSNRAGIGARVTVTAGGLTMTREVSSSSGRSSQNQLAPHFGLGAASVAERLEVRWPSGTVQVLEGVPAGVVDVQEPDA